MHINVQSFGMLVPICGDQYALTIPKAPIQITEVLELLIQTFPELAKHLPYVACAIGDTQVERDAVINEDDTLVLLPPVSGG